MKRSGWMLIPLVVILLSGCFSPRPASAVNTEFNEAYSKFRALFYETIQFIEYATDENGKYVLKHADINALRANLAVLRAFADGMVEKADTDHEKLHAVFAETDCLNINTLSYLAEEMEYLPAYDARKASDVIDSLMRRKEFYEKEDN